MTRTAYALVAALVIAGAWLIGFAVDEYALALHWRGIDVPAVPIKVGLWGLLGVALWAPWDRERA